MNYFSISYVIIIVGEVVIESMTDDEMRIRIRRLLLLESVLGLFMFFDYTMPNNSDF